MKNNGYIYKHVVVLGVDGAGTFFSRTDTPNMDRIFANGATNYNVLTSIPTISAECWGSMLLGVTPEVHRRTNGIVSSIPYDTESPFPSLFRAIRAAYPDAELASFCCWNPINYGIIENNLGVYEDTAGDDELTDMICDYLKDHDPTMLFVQFDKVDGAGHGYGYGTKEHLDRITVTDGLIGRIYDKYVERGFIDDTLFIVTADTAASVTAMAVPRTTKRSSSGVRQARPSSRVRSVRWKSATMPLSVSMPSAWNSPLPGPHAFPMICLQTSPTASVPSLQSCQSQQLTAPLMQRLRPILLSPHCSTQMPSRLTCRLRRPITPMRSERPL